MTMMTTRNDYLSNTENIINSIRSIYSSYGYERYIMSKFEEYDLYSSNRGYLVSDRLITFTDQEGRLMALKPDITLSIIKNLGDERLKKLYYNENVYRASRNDGEFREINQLGLEVIGDVDTYQISEVLDLALKSLSLISESYILDITDIDITYSIVNAITEDSRLRASYLKAVSERNEADIRRLAKDNCSDERLLEALISLVNIYGPLNDNMSEVEEILLSVGFDDLYRDFYSKVRLIADTHVNLDFSIVSSDSYYNGIVFKGYIESIKEEVLSGGEYRNLVKKMRKKGSGIGFAVYADTLKALDEKKRGFIETSSDSKENFCLQKQCRRRG